MIVSSWAIGNARDSGGRRRERHGSVGRWRRGSGPILALATDGLEEKEALLQAHPQYLFTIPHFDNYAAVLLHLGSADDADLREPLQDAWLVHAPADLARRFLDQRER